MQSSISIPDRLLRTGDCRSQTPKWCQLSPICFLDVTEISDEDSQFYPSFVVSFSWQDFRLISDAGDQSATAIQKSSIL